MKHALKPYLILLAGLMLLFVGLGISMAQSCAEGDPQKLVFEYTPSDCSASNNQQSSDSCDGALVSAIKEVMTSDGTATFADSIVTITAAGDRFPSDTDIAITDVDDNTQDLTIHTSCSQPLDVGDVFGSLTLIVFNRPPIPDRVQQLEADVEELKELIENHTHIYHTGEGEGHNNTEAETGPAIPLP